MSYVFSSDGTFAASYSDKDPRVFILQGLRMTPTPAAVAQAITRMTPVSIVGCRVMMILNEPVLRDLAATIFSESFHNALESEGIMRVIRNRATLKHASYGSSNFWSAVGADGIDGRKTSNFRQANGKPIETWRGNMLLDLQATVRALVNPGDVTTGAYFWIATRIKGGDNIFGNGLANNPPDFVVTQTYGQTTFLKYNGKSPTYKRHTWP